MNRQEYKQLSHDIRLKFWKIAKHISEKTGKNVTTRCTIHNLLCWCDNSNTDKFGKSLYKYRCVGDYDTGLVWEKSFKI